MVLGTLAAVELLVFALAAGRFGILLMLLVVVATSAFGASLLFRQTAGLVRDSVEELASTSSARTGQLGDRGLRVAAGLLLVFPGLVTGALGALLLVPPVRSAVKQVVGRRLNRLIPTDVASPFADLDRMFRRRDVVDVDAIRRDPDGSQTDTTAPPELH